MTVRWAFDRCGHAAAQASSCCLMKLNDPDDRCSEVATFVALLLEDGVATEHLRCAHHAERERERSTTLAIQPYPVPGPVVRARPGYWRDAGQVSGELVALISQWIDDSPSYAGLDEELVLWRRCTKVASEVGEAIDALAGMVGENPRKGVTHTLDDLIGELLDCALAALGAVEHVTGNAGNSIELLARKVDYVLDRAGLVVAVGDFS